MSGFHPVISLHTSSKLDNKIKSEVVVDMLNLAGFRLPPRLAKEETKRGPSSPKKLHEKAAEGHVSDDLADRSSLLEHDYNRLPIHNPEQLRYNLTNAEKKKHRAYAARSQSPPDMKTILDAPTTDDTLMLVTTINEWYRASLGRFERIYPQHGSQSASMMSMIDSAGGDGPSMYSGQLGTPRYYDALLYQFVQRFGTPLVEGAPTVFESEEGVKEASARSPSKQGGHNFRVLSKALGISIKGLLFVTKLAEQHMPSISSALDTCRTLEIGKNRGSKASPLPPSPPINVPKRVMEPHQTSARSVGRLPRVSELQPSTLPNIRPSSLKGRCISITCQSARQSCQWSSQVATTSTRSQAATRLLVKPKSRFSTEF
ncbi:unnamed protein product [Hydatigera taeniaeformis]|uniref:TF_AP-2 domain-containing protein n=1 Tax=Hydatigena taeniaeformis TaxID=6205 RepID=A0A0R3WPT7_HYDTA|nr:unnamed protein product [Hydatigera taeniaeformis]